MGIKIWIGNEYSTTHENRMVGEAISVLENTYGSLAEECHVLVNFRIPGDPPRPGERPYTSEIDMAVLKPKGLILVDLKNYVGRIEYGDSCRWICHAANGDVEVHGGREGRTPHGQLCDYRRQMIALLAANQFQFVNGRGHVHPFDIRRFVSGMVLFPASDAAADEGHFDTDCGRWLTVVRMGGFAEAVCGRCGGRDAELSSLEMGDLITKVLHLTPAHMVGGVPKVGAVSENAIVRTITKIVTVVKPVEMPVPKIVRDEYGAILLAYDSEDANAKRISDMSDIFRRLVARERKRRFKETQVRSLGAAAELLLRDDADLSRCVIRLFRLSAAVHKNADLIVSRADVDETFKTLCRVAMKFSGEPMPEAVRKRCDAITYRASTVSPSASVRDGLTALFLEVVSVDAEHGTFRGVVRDDEARPEYVFRSPDFELTPGRVVCAVTPMRDGDVWKASEIVLEPDYLLSPQAIGRAAEIGNAALYFWLDTIRDSPDEKYRVPGSDGITMAAHVLLGNFANACLAERCGGGTEDVQRLLGRYCRENIMDITDAAPARNWVTECQHEERNITHVLTETLPREHGYISRNWQIEAPLYSPQYGLSARADALSYAPDRSSAVVFELKSGKWDSFKGERPKAEHVCQPSFYGEILGFSAGLPRESVQPFLYYAKTIPANPRYGDSEKSGKLFLRPSVGGKSVSALVQHFVGVRNRIMSMEVLSREGRLRPLIDNATVDSFRNPHWTDNLWSRYKRPELESMLEVFQRASDLEKRYFYRMLQFAAEESFTARIGDAGSEIGRGGSCMSWRLPVDKRQTSGLRLSELVRIPQDGDEDALKRFVRLTFDMTRNRFNSACSIRQGDAVGLYADGPETNLTNSVVFAASVEKFEPGRVTFLLDDPQPAVLFGLGSGVAFAAEAVPMHGWGNYHALWHFLSGDGRRRALVLNETSPATEDETCPLPVSADVLEKRYSGVKKWLPQAWRAKDWYLIWGPPGTGKTSHAMRALVDESMAVPGMRILLLAYTYKATDKICEMLEKRMEDQSRRGESLDAYMRIGNPQKCDAALRARMPGSMGLAKSEAVRSALETTRIFVGTVSTLGPKHALCGLVRHFDLAIVDEASQLLDTHLLPLFCAKRQDGNQGPLVGKFILIGDDCQLPAVVQQNTNSSRIEDDALRERGFRDCRESFFSRLKRVANGDSRFIGMLDRQFRMHPMIADFCNHYFYADKLQNGNAPRQMAGLPPIPEDASPFARYVLGTRLGFFPVVGERGEGGKVNRNEAKTCVQVMQTLLTTDSRPAEDGGATRRYQPEDIAVIVPFRNQIACLRDAIGAELGKDAAGKVVVDTVERHQGGERPVVIFSTVIASSDQADWMSAKRYDDDDDGDESAEPIDRKLNVAVTRAQERFYLVGNEHVLSRLRAYGELLRWIEERAGFCEGVF